MLEALKALSTFFAENSLRTRRNLRGDIERRSLAINEEFVRIFKQVKEVMVLPTNMLKMAGTEFSIANFFTIFTCYNFFFPFSRANLPLCYNCFYPGPAGPELFCHLIIFLLWNFCITMIYKQKYVGTRLSWEWLDSSKSVKIYGLKEPLQIKQDRYIHTTLVTYTSLNTGTGFTGVWVGQMTSSQGTAACSRCYYWLSVG